MSKNDEAAMALAPSARRRGLTTLNKQIVACDLCPRLVAWRSAAAQLPRALEGPYFARGLPGFGDLDASLVLVGLAPAAHGGNRTGRMFTGDRSGDFLIAALHRGGFASKPTSVTAEDGLVLTHAYITAAVRCAPPENKPLPEETENCAPFLRRELALLSKARVFLALGAFAFDALVRDELVGRQANTVRRPRFSHGLETTLESPDGTVRTILASYHPSQRNVFTGRLTAEMFDAVVERARELCS